MRRTCLALCVVLGGCLGCERDDKLGTSTTTVTAAEVPSASVSFIEQQPELSRSVERAVAEDPLLSIAAKNVGISVENGSVTLSGSVFDESHRREIERVVKRVPGITDVRDEIEVSLTRDFDDHESDERIAFALQRSLASLPGISDDSERVTIDVQHGRVALRGQTRFETTRQRIGEIARTTPGVNFVINKIVIR